MFTAYREKLRKSKAEQKKNGEKNKLNSLFYKMEDPEKNKEDQSDSESDEDDQTFLDNIFLQKTTYCINGRNVEQSDDKYYEPVSFIDSIEVFQSGQVYRVLTRDLDGNFSSLNQKKGVESDEPQKKPQDKKKKYD